MKYSGKMMTPVSMMTPQIQSNQTLDTMESTMTAAPMAVKAVRQTRNVRAHGRMEPPPPNHHGGFHNSNTKMAPGEHGGMGVGPGAVIGHEKHSYSIAVEPFPGGPPPHVHLPCVGDFNCPGTMKCCSGDMSVYSDGTAIARNVHPTHGFCVEPMMM
jgi:hypothetical protein